ncbi:Rab guanyl-nucleotide exchange factor [Aureococcus anophagefferens]|nr:Rab guanyl-nucleotide exchange factor [Aureococcus anophagefferens]
MQTVACGYGVCGLDLGAPQLVDGGAGVVRTRAQEITAVYVGDRSSSRTRPRRDARNVAPVCAWVRRRGARGRRDDDRSAVAAVVAAGPGGPPKGHVVMARGRVGDARWAPRLLDTYASVHGEACAGAAAFCFPDRGLRLARLLPAPRGRRRDYGALATFDALCGGVSALVDDRRAAPPVAPSPKKHRAFAASPRFDAAWRPTSRRDDDDDEDLLAHAGLPHGRGGSFLGAWLLAAAAFPDFRATLAVAAFGLATTCALDDGALGAAFVALARSGADVAGAAALTEDRSMSPATPRLAAARAPARPGSWT